MVPNLGKAATFFKKLVEQEGRKTYAARKKTVKMILWA